MPKETIFISSVQKEFTIYQLLNQGAIERYGTGIPEMFLLSTESGLKSPDFKDDKTFSVTLWRPSASTGQDTGQDTGQVTGQVQFFNDLTEPERVILVLEGEMMREELMSILELRHRDNFMEKYLNPSIAKGWVERTIPDKPTSSKQRYRLSQSGIEHKKNFKNEK